MPKRGAPKEGALPGLGGEYVRADQIAAGKSALDAETRATRQPPPAGVSPFAMPKAPLPNLTDKASINAALLVARRNLKIVKARENLLDFIEYCMPDPEHPDDVTKSQFQAKAYHKCLIEGMERVGRRELMRSAWSLPPQHGKSTIISKYGVAWIWARNPTWHIIVGTYGETFAEKIGGEVREVINSQRFKDVFPDFELQKGLKGKTALGNTKGGTLTFVGRGTATTGRPCDLFLIDDPLKDDQEARSAAVRRELKDWYSGVVFSRCHVKTPILIVHTRWHEDDLIGWQCDPEHPDNKDDPDKLAATKRWTYLNIPAIVDEPALAQALGMEVGEAIWPERFPLEHLAEAKQTNGRIFAALYMGRPSPEDGDFFTLDMLKPYRKDQLPDRLRIYAASDHAVAEKQHNDRTCCLIAGVDDHDEIWILPDIFWERSGPEKVVNAIIRLMKQWTPAVWWAENGHIAKSIGPFLRKRMREERTYITISEQTATADKEQRAQSIRGRMSMGMVRFPVFAWWWEDAKAELLKFPNGRHDDFVDALSWIGLGLTSQIKASSKPRKIKKEVKVGSIGWIKQQAGRERRQSEIDKRLASM